MDAHAHLDFFARSNRLEGCLSRAWQGGLQGIITVGTSPADWNQHRTIAATDPRIVFTVGLHPTEIDPSMTPERIGDLLAAEMDRQDRPVAIGEIGLDYHRPERGPDEWRRQREIFSRQLELARRWDLPVVIHCRDRAGHRDAWLDCLDLIGKAHFDGPMACMHCFSYGPEEMALWLELGAVASFTGVITYDSAEAIRRALVLEPLDRIMFETDCPFLLPAGRRGEADENEPLFVLDTIRRGADLIGISADELADRSTLNTRRFFGL